MMTFTTNVTEAVELIPFEEALREMKAGAPMLDRDGLWLTEGIPLAVAACALLALYVAV